MNTLKKILMFVLAMTLLVCVALSFASCNGLGTGNNTGTQDGEHCPEDCECRDDDKASVPEGYHCSAGCECRVDDYVPNTAPAKITYIVVVRDDQGNFIPGVGVSLRKGENTTEKTTTVDGVAAFPLVQGSWKVTVNEETIPLGYKAEEGVVFYDFDENGVCSIELKKPIGYTFAAKSAYTGKAYEDVTVSFYAWDAVNEEYSKEAAVTAKTGENGQVTIDTVRGKYLVKFDIEGTHYADEITIDVPSDAYEVEIMDDLGSSSNNPIAPESDTINPTVANGKAIWFSIKKVEGKKLIVNDPDAYVIYEGQPYSPSAETGIIEVPLVDNNTNNNVFAIGYKSDAEDAPAEKEINAVLVAPLGSYSNPNVLDSVSELDKVSLEASKESNEIWYKWTPNVTGRLFLLCASENNLIQINDGENFTEINVGAPYVQFDIVKDVTVYISVSATNDALEYVKADLDIDALVYAKYVVEVYNADNTPNAGACVWFYRNDNSTAAMVTVDQFGYAEILLPADDYKLVCPQAPSGYIYRDKDVDSDWTEAYFYADPYTMADFANDDGVGYTIKIPANTTYYFAERLPGLYNLTLNGAENAKLVVGEQEYTATEGVITAKLAGSMFMPAAFQIVNTGDAEITLVATLAAVPGYSFDNPITAVLGENVAEFNVEYGTEVFFSYTATAKGTLKITSSNALAGIIANNPMAGIYGDMNDVAPIEITVAVDNGEIVEIVVGTNNWDITEADIEFNIEFIPLVNE